MRDILSWEFHLMLSSSSPCVSASASDSFIPRGRSRRRFASSTARPAAGLRFDGK